MKLFYSTSALALASLAHAQTTKVCPSGGEGACYQFNVPSNTANSGNGDIFFQLSAPATAQWVGLGEGNQMAGANIFVVYAAGDGQNVTLSPRSGKGEFQPLFDSAAQVSLLDGSGISNGQMTANVRCSNCESWSRGRLDVKSTSGSWIWAIKNGAGVNSDSPSANLIQHDVMGTFDVDLTQATGGSSTNPFTSAAASNTSSSGAATSSMSSSPGDSGSGSGSMSGGKSSAKEKSDRMHIAHGVLMGLAFLIFFPIGALTIRLLHVPGTVWIHGGSQLFAYSLAIAGLGVGIWIALDKQELSDAHPIIGMVVIGFLFFQPIGGWLHHHFYAKGQRKASLSLGHVWIGRCLLILGAINGGLGRQLAANTTGGEIVWGVIAGVMFLIYIVVVFLAQRRNNGTERSGQNGANGALIDEHHKEGPTTSQ